MPDQFAPKRQKIRRPLLGDMRHRIEIRTRSITPPSVDGVDFGESFVTTNTVYAALDTVTGEQLFDGTNVEISGITHIFTIRSISGLTEEKWIDYKGNRYDIKSIETFDARGLFMKLRCVLRGDKTKPVNAA